MEEVKKKQGVSLSEVKEILGKVDPEEMDQIQRWTFDYVSKLRHMFGFDISPSNVFSVYMNLIKRNDTEK